MQSICLPLKSQIRVWQYRFSSSFPPAQLWRNELWNRLWNMFRITGKLSSKRAVHSLSRDYCVCCRDLGVAFSRLPSQNIIIRTFGAPSACHLQADSCSSLSCMLNDTRRWRLSCPPDGCCFVLPPAWWGSATGWPPSPESPTSGSVINLP